MGTISKKEALLNTIENKKIEDKVIDDINKHLKIFYTGQKIVIHNNYTILASEFPYLFYKLSFGFQSEKTFFKEILESYNNSWKTEIRTEPGTINEIMITFE